MYVQAMTTKDDCGGGGGSIVMVAMQNKAWITNVWEMLQML